MSKSIAVVVALLAGRSLLTASEKEPLTASVKADYQTVRNFVVRAAEKMPADDYAFKPTPEVRSFAQQIAHIADDQYNLCAPAKGEARKAAYTAIEDSLTIKADLITALKDAFAYCDGAYAMLTDASGSDPAVGKTGRTRFGMLNWDVWHTWEHYGNIVVYLRLKGLVPPSSERR